MRKILVIEDSPLVLKILEHLFRQEPTLQPVFCASLAEAEVMLAAIEAHAPLSPGAQRPAWLSNAANHSHRLIVITIGEFTQSCCKSNARSTLRRYNQYSRRVRQNY